MARLVFGKDTHWECSRNASVRVQLLQTSFTSESTINDACTPTGPGSGQQPRDRRHGSGSGLCSHVPNHYVHRSAYHVSLNGLCSRGQRYSRGTMNHGPADWRGTAAFQVLLPWVPGSPLNGKLVTWFPDCGAQGPRAISISQTRSAATAHKSQGKVPSDRASEATVKLVNTTYLMPVSSCD